MQIQENIVDFFTQAVNFVQAFTADVVAIIGVFLVLIFFTFQFGKSRMVAFILALYISLLLFLNFQYFEYFDILTNFIENETTQITVTNILVFLITLFIVYKIIGRAIATDSPQDLLHKWFEVLIMAVVGTTLIIAFIYHALPISSFHEFGPEIDRLFASPELFFWWLVIPLVALFFVLPRRIT